MKLLLVDDEAELVSALQEDLQARGYQVLTASDGMTAVELARSERPDLILLDLMLPVLDGYRVLKLLKSDERFRAIPILVITARANEEDWALALECGADGCLTKPLKRDTLYQQIHARLGNGHGHAHGKEASPPA